VLRSKSKDCGGISICECQGVRNMRMGVGGISLCTKHQTLSLALNVLGSRHSNGDSLRVHAVVRVPAEMDEVLAVVRAEC